MTLARHHWLAVRTAVAALVVLLAGCTSGGTVGGTEVGAPASSASTPSPTSDRDTTAADTSTSDTPTTETPTTDSPAPASSATGPTTSGSSTSTVTTVRTVTPPARTAPSSTTPAPTSALPTTSATPTSDASTTPSSTSVGGSAHSLCAADTSAEAIAQCLREDLSTYWSGRINDTISEPVRLDPAPSSVPAECRPGLEVPAFTCRSDKQLYITRTLLDLIGRQFPKQDLIYALASVQSHEFGHVLQYTLHQPEVAKITTDEQSQFVEQQADCLSGVWAHDADGIDRGHFRAVAVKLITLVSSNPEILSHGTPAQRAAALDRGLASGRPQTCRLTTFG